LRVRDEDVIEVVLLPPTVRFPLLTSKTLESMDINPKPKLPRVPPDSILLKKIAMDDNYYCFT